MSLQLVNKCLLQTIYSCADGRHSLDVLDNETLRLHDVDLLLKLSIEECCVNVHLMDLQAMDKHQ